VRRALCGMANGKEMKAKQNNINQLKFKQL